MTASDGSLASTPHTHHSGLIPQALRALLWLALLVATIPAVSRQWVFSWTDPTLTPGDYLTTLPGLVYAGCCALIVLGFAVFAAHRRILFSAFAAALLYAQLDSERIGWDRAAALLAVLAGLTIAVEAIRQNVPLYRQLRRDDQLTLKLLGQSLLLWSPLLLVIYLGVLANQALFAASERLAYDTTPMDPWCRVDDGQGAQTIPCAGMTGRILPAAVQTIPAQAAVTQHVRARLSRATAEILAAIADPAAHDWVDDDLGAATRRAITERMNPARVLGIEAEPDPGAAAVAKDEKIRRLDQSIADARRQISTARAKGEQFPLPSIMPWGGPSLADQLRKAAIEKALEKPKRHLARLQEQRRARAKVVRDQALKSEQQAPGGPGNRLRRQLFPQLNVTTSVDKSAFPRRNGWPSPDLNDPGERRDALMTAVIRGMDAREKAVLTAVLPHTNTAARAATLYAALLITPRCTTARVDDRVTSQDGEATTINRGDFRCFEDHPEDGLPLTPVGLAESASLSIDRWQSDSERAGLLRLRALASGTHKSADAFAEEARAVSNAVPQTIDLGRKECHLVTNPINCITNYLKDKSEEGYEQARADLVRQVNPRIDAQTDAAAQSADAQIIAAREDMYRILDGSAELMRISVDKLRQLGQIVAVLLTLFLVVATIKSFLYVLATRVFDAKSDLTIQLGDGGSVQGDYVSAPSVTIPHDFQRPLITREVLDNQDNATALMPWPLSAPLARILHGVYFVFNKGSHFEHGEGEMSFTRGSGSHIVDWHLKEGEEVVFHYGNFFGASDNVQLKTTISLRLSTMLLGRFVFHSAVCTEGDGRLLLTARGTVSDQAKTDSTSLERLIAWNRHTRFRVSSKGTIKSVFLDGYTIVRLRDDEQPSGLIVVEAIGEGSRKVMGAVRFIRTLLLPF